MLFAFSVRGTRFAGSALLALLLLLAHFADHLDWDGYRPVPPFWDQFWPNSITHLGGENFKIGFQVARGRGFSDPFGFESGPTAWMPPVYPLYCTLLVWMFGKDVQSMGTLTIVIQAAVLGLIWHWLIEMARPGSRRQRMILFLSFAAFLLTHFHLTFRFTHDHLFAILSVAAIMRFAPPKADHTAKRVWVLWGGLGGFATLSAPVCLLPWLLLTVVHYRHAPGFQLRSLCVLVVVLLPWTIRNAIMFQTFVPVKSNAFYELYQSLNYSQTGVVSPAVFNYHPSSGGPEFLEFRAYGEAEFLRLKRRQSLELIRDDPGRYLRHCLNRGLAILIWEDPSFERQRFLVPRVFCRIVYLLPALGLLAIVIRRQWRRMPSSGSAILVLLGLSLPYALLSFYDRYEYMFGPVKILLTYYLFCKAPAGGEATAPPFASVDPHLTSVNPQPPG